MDWQPIETAPENARILVAHWFHTSHMGVEIKEKCRGEFIYPSRYYRPVAWMPLPPPPCNGNTSPPPRPADESSPRS